MKVVGEEPARVEGLTLRKLGVGTSRRDVGFDGNGGLVS